MPIAVNDRLVIPDAELSWRFSPSGGPGGQHANKAHTRAELAWSIVESTALSQSQRRRLVEKLGPSVTVVVDDERSQTRNRDLAQERLAGRIRAALVVPKTRHKTKPSRGSQERRLKTKRGRSRDKQLRRPPARDD